MKLYNGRSIIIGLAVFLLLAVLPVWYNLATGKGPAPDGLELPDPQKHPQCVAPTDYMRGSHMILLNEWRDLVVRRGVRVYEAFDGTKYNMSLSQTCLSCHSDAEAFCNRCHTYVGVHPYCWDCHIERPGD